MPIQGASVPNNLGQVLVCVDRAADGDFSGRLYSPFAERSAPFCGILELIARMERLFDRLSFPQPMFSYRTFREVKRRRPVRLRPVRREVRRYHGDELYEREAGEIATFVVRVSYRRNATWQGFVRWTERAQVCAFASALELLRLLAAALPDAGANWSVPAERTRDDE